VSKTTARRLKETVILVEKALDLIRKVNVGCNETRALREALSLLEETKAAILRSPSYLWEG